MAAVASYKGMPQQRSSTLKTVEPFWTRVAKNVGEGRTAAACRNRYDRLYANILVRSTAHRGNKKKGVVSFAEAQTRCSPDAELHELTTLVCSLDDTALEDVLHSSASSSPLSSIYEELEDVDVAAAIENVDAPPYAFTPPVSEMGTDAPPAPDRPPHFASSLGEPRYLNLPVPHVHAPQARRVV